MTWPAVGTPVPPLERRMEPHALAAYGGATWDWHRLHYDRDYARERGLPAPVVDGQLFGALFAQMVQDWLGPGAALVELSFRFRRPVFVGDLVRCEGEVAERRSDGIRCELRTVVVDPGGGEPRVVVAPASAELRSRR